jgi:hypothetical protein
MHGKGYFRSGNRRTYPCIPQTGSQTPLEFDMGDLYQTLSGNSDFQPCWSITKPGSHMDIIYTVYSINQRLTNFVIQKKVMFCTLLHSTTRLYGGDRSSTKSLHVQRAITWSCALTTKLSKRFPECSYIFRNLTDLSNQHGCNYTVTNSWERHRLEWAVTRTLRNYAT